MKTLEELIELSEKEVKFREYLKTKYDLNRECEKKFIILIEKNGFLARWAWLNTPLEDPLSENKLKILCITWNMAGQVSITKGKKEK
jgi:hypothetical protein